jgi:hypothetical protein
MAKRSPYLSHFTIQIILKILNVVEWNTKKDGWTVFVSIHRSNWFSSNNPIMLKFHEYLAPPPAYSGKVPLHLYRICLCHLPSIELLLRKNEMSCKEMRKKIGEQSAISFTTKTDFHTLAYFLFIIHYFVR